MKLTAKQQQALTFIKSELDQGKRFPTLDSIARHCGTKWRSVAKSYLGALIEKKFIRKEQGQYMLSDFQRQFKYVNDKNTDDYHHPPTAPFTVTPEYFGVDIEVFEVVDNQFSEADGIFKGDVAVISKDDKIEINDEDIFLWKRRNGRWMLRKKLKTKTDDKIQGKLVGIIRKLDKK